MVEQKVGLNNRVSQSSGLAVTALVVGIVAVVFGWTGVFGLILAIVAIVFGVIALVKNQSKVKAVWGIVLGGVALVTSIIVLIIAAAVVTVLDETIKTSGQTDTTQSATDTTYTVGRAIDFDNKKVYISQMIYGKRNYLKQ